MIFFAHMPTAITQGLPLDNLISLTIQVLGLILFVVAVAFAYKHCKRTTCSVRSKGKQLRKLEILETKPLGNRQFLLVVAYEQEKFLLGAHPNGIQFLSKLHANSDKRSDFTKKLDRKF